MHRIWLSKEVASKVLRQLPDRECYHLGITCRWLWLIAHPFLWRCVTSGAALVATLPDEHSLGITSNENGFTLSRAVTVQEWDRVKLYSAWTEVLSVPDTEAEVLSDDEDDDDYNSDSDESSLTADSMTVDSSSTLRALILLSTCPNLPHLYPRLRKVKLGIESSLSAQVSISLLSRLTLESVEITLWDRQGAWYSALGPGIWHAFASSSRTLRHASIDAVASTQSSGLQLDWSLLAGPLATLTSLSLQGIHLEPALFSATSKMTGLEHLQLTFPTAANARAWNAGGRFPALESLALGFSRTNPPLNLTHVLRGMGAPALRSIRLSLTSDLAHLEDIFSILHRKWRNTLLELRLNIDGALEPAQQDRMQALISRVEPWPHLRHLEVNSNVLIPIIDSDIAHLVRCMPNLEELHFSLNLIIESIPTCTRGALFHIARGLPRLRRLTLDLDFDRPEALMLTPPGYQSTSQLCDFQGQCCSCDAPDSAALFLRALFPRLKTFGTDDIPWCWQGYRELLASVHRAYAMQGRLVEARQGQV